MAEEIPDCCDGCIKYQEFGKECWVYWEAKKSCTQHTPMGEEINFK
jgi:hypothetical protein